MTTTTTFTTPGTTIASIVLEHPECASVFQDHRIDFCCRGGVSLQDACADKGIDLASMTAALERAVRDRSGRHEQDFRAMSQGELVDHIVRRHHGYLRRTMGPVAAMAAKVARVHGEHNPKLVALDAAYRELVAALEPHLEQEERVLFPALLSQPLDSARVASELADMKTEHLAVGALLERIRAAADDFTLPDWACNTYRALFSELEAMEGDVLRHVHLENHVLAARVVA